MVKTRHSLSCFEKLPGPEGRSILKLRLERFCVGFGSSVETPKKPLLTALDITGTTSANWSAEKRVHPSAPYSISLRRSRRDHLSC